MSGSGRGCDFAKYFAIVATGKPPPTGGHVFSDTQRRICD